MSQAKPENCGAEFDWHDPEERKVENQIRKMRRHNFFKAAKVSLGAVAVGSIALGVGFGVNTPATLDFLSSIAKPIVDFWQDNATYLGDKLNLGDTGGQLTEAIILALAIAIIVALTYYFLRPLPAIETTGDWRDQLNCIPDNVSNS